MSHTYTYYAAHKRRKGGKVRGRVEFVILNAINIYPFFTAQHSACPRKGPKST